MIVNSTDVQLTDLANDTDMKDVRQGETVT